MPLAIYALEFATRKTRHSTFGDQAPRNTYCRMRFHRLTIRQGTPLCHVTWTLTYTRFLVVVEILALTRHGHSVHLRKVAIQRSSFKPETEQEQHMQVTVSLTLCTQACFVGTQRTSTTGQKTSASASRVRSSNCIYNCYLSSLDQMVLSSV